MVLYVIAQTFQGLDYVIVEARRHRIRLILSLVNNLNAFGGKAQYVRWAKEAGINVSSSSDSFFSNTVIKKYYKDYVKVGDALYLSIKKKYEMSSLVPDASRKHLSYHCTVCL